MFNSLVVVYLCMQIFQLTTERDDLLDKKTKVEKDFENLVHQEGRSRQQLVALQSEVVGLKKHAQALEVLEREVAELKKQSSEMVEKSQQEVTGLRSALEGK
jgi:cell division protein FtsL